MFFSKINWYFARLKEFNLDDGYANIGSCDILFYCHDANRGVNLNGQAYSPLIDSLKDRFDAQGYVCQTIAQPWSVLLGDLAYGRPIAINRRYFFAKMLKSVFLFMRIKDPVVRLFESIFVKSNPKLIITIGCGDEFCEAARNLGFLHMELLHGIGYTSIPWKWDEKPKKNLPQGVISLDPVSTKTFSDLSKHGVLIKEIQHPFLSRFQGNMSHDIPAEWLPVEREKKYKKEVLVSLQWGYLAGVDEFPFFKGLLSNGLFYEELAEVVKKTADTVLWRFRFHPVQYRQYGKYKGIFEFIESFTSENDNCEWKEATYIPLPSLLLRCSGHITMSSMTSYEAAYLGVPTLALDPSLEVGGIYEDVFHDLVQNGYLTKSRPSVAAIYNWLCKAERKEFLLKNLSCNEELDLEGLIELGLSGSLGVN
ncbi:hypothetical protein [Stutzerimonas nitrititolerans]|uniref:hypothetical protein n=1 Tax=Stutzerimonas nitrititolerans TaxID=2482751 RepID=UPI0028A94BB8|nr:hypothetical protein [Stutzerimonas nitrititolerans]